MVVIILCLYLLLLVLMFFLEHFMKMGEKSDREKMNYSEIKREKKRDKK